MQKSGINKGHQFQNCHQPQKEMNQMFFQNFLIHQKTKNQNKNQLNRKYVRVHTQGSNKTFLKSNMDQAITNKSSDKKKYENSLKTVKKEYPLNYRSSQSNQAQNMHHNTNFNIGYHPQTKVKKQIFANITNSMQPKLSKQKLSLNYLINNVFSTQNKPSQKSNYLQSNDQINPYGYTQQLNRKSEFLLNKQKKNSLKSYGQYNNQNVKNLNNQSKINNQSNINNQSYLDKKTTNNFFRGSFNSKIIRKTSTDCNDHSLIQTKKLRYTTLNDCQGQQMFQEMPQQNGQSQNRKLIIKRQPSAKFFYQQNLTFTQPQQQPCKPAQSLLFFHNNNNLNRKSSQIQINQMKKAWLHDQDNNDQSKLYRKSVTRMKTQPYQNKIDQIEEKENQIAFGQVNRENRTSLNNFIKKEPANAKEITYKVDFSKVDYKRDLKFEDKIGQGTFGKVYKVKLRLPNSIQVTFAVKKVLIDKKYKSRELQIVSMLRHPNIMKVHHIYTSQSGSQSFLNILMDPYPFNLFQIINKHGMSHSAQSLSISKSISPLQHKLFLYQMLKSLSYIHSLNVCHRDVKPHNMLVKGWELVLCDFGSAKVLNQGEANLAYICSRCYRAPELIFGATDYTTQIDLWSVGCIILEIINKMPLFIGQNSLDHLLQVIKVLGTPSKNQVMAMNPDYDLSDYQLPYIKRKSLAKIFPKADPLLIDLTNNLLVYSPKQRLTAIDALCHNYFNQIRQKNILAHLLQQNLISKQVGSSLFTFSVQQLKQSRNPKIHQSLVPCFK